MERPIIFGWAGMRGVVSFAMAYQYHYLLTDKLSLIVTLFCLSRLLLFWSRWFSRDLHFHGLYVN